MNVRLKVLAGKNAGKEVPISMKKFLIGRAEDCQLRPGSDMISRHHCELNVEEGRLSVRDFDSRNGTFVNDERIEGERDLKSGDRLRVGPLEFEVHIAHGLGGKKRPPVSDVKEAASRAAESAGRQAAGLDVSSWLAPEDDFPGGSTVAAPSTSARQAARAPQAVPAPTTVPAPQALVDTSYPRLSDTQSGTAPGTGSQPSDPSLAQPRTGKKEFGKLPLIPKQATTNSQEAAANVLKMLRKRQ